MSTQFLGRFKPGSDEWVEARRRRVGGSEAAVCLGLSPYESLFSLWHRKAGLVEPVQQDNVMEWGNRLEEAILGRWLEDHPAHQLVHRNSTFLSTVHPFMIANPDALVTNEDGELELIEVKTSPFGDYWGPSGSDDPDHYPVWYRAQILHYMLVMGVRRAYLPVLIQGCDYREYVIGMDDAAHADTRLIVDAERAFIDSLPGGPAERRPDIDAHSQTLQVVRDMHPDIEAGESVELDEEVAEAYLAAHQAAKEAEAAKRKASATVLDAIGDAQYATHNGQRIASRQARGDGKPYLVAARSKSTTTKAA